MIAADLVAVLMMVPKTWRDPHSETLSTYVLAAGSGALALGAVGSLSVPLLAYPAYFFAVNAAVSALIAHRRAVLSRRPGPDGRPSRRWPRCSPSRPRTGALRTSEEASSRAVRRTTRRARARLARLEAEGPHQRSRRASVA